MQHVMYACAYVFTEYRNMSVNRAACMFYTYLVAYVDFEHYASEVIMTFPICLPESIAT